jgi:MGT family glycosyltransferase
MPDLEEKIRSEGLDYCPIGRGDYPIGSLSRTLDEIGRRKGVEALRFTIRAVARSTLMVCRDTPAAIRQTGVDALLVDQMEPAGGAVAEHLGIPFVTVCNALAINRDPATPPPFTPWTYRDVWWARWRNQMGYAASDWQTRSILRVVADYREKWHLPALRSQEESFSRLLQICQMPRELDFPRSCLPDSFHYVGPLRDVRRKSVPFPWDRLDGRPLVYASLGTLQNAREPLFRCFAEACRGLRVQLVLSHGGGLTREQAAALPGDPVVVAYAPQVELLARACLTITHAGLNTVLDSLSHGVPLVVVPITYEQPAIARRVEWAGAGRCMPLSRARPDRLRDLVSTVLRNERYRNAARRLAGDIRSAGGVQRAADIVETSVSEHDRIRAGHLLGKRPSHHDARVTAG